jgi:tetratricopeptide (TPR) repeat protein
MTSSLPARRLIPRWRPTRRSLRRSEAASTNNASSVGPVRDSRDELARCISAWHATGAPGVLGDVLSFAVDPELVEIVREVGLEALRIGAATTPLQVRLIRELGASEVVDQGGELASPGLTSQAHPFQDPIRRLRALLRFAPDNSLALLDFAQLQAAVGKNDAAERALRTALSLAPSNRLVLRTFARFLVHANRADEAHQLLRRHQRTPTDPWLMASEVAIADAAGRTGEFLAKGKRLLMDKGAFSHEHVTELAGVVAMAELKSGNLKRAREAQRRALLAPNDNVVAQAVEFRVAFNVALDTPPVKLALTNASEARLLQAWMSADPDGVEKHALGWHSEEPFSSRPIQLLTAMYAYRGQFNHAIRWGKAGLVTDPFDRGVLINLAFAYAGGGEVDRAEQAVRRLRQHHQRTAEPYAKATEGLIAYQRRNFDSGDALYSEAAALFEKAHQPQVAAYCRINQALSAIDCDHPRLDEIVRVAGVALRQHPSQDSMMLLKTRTIAGIGAPVVEEPAQRRLTQWVFDPGTNTLTERAGVTAIGANSIIVAKRSA